MGDAGTCQAIADPTQRLVRRRLLVQAREDPRPFVPRHPLHHFQLPDPVNCEPAADGAEGGEAPHVDPHPQIVHEAIVPYVVQGDATFRPEDAAGDLLQLGQRILPRLVLERIEAERSQRRVQREDEIPAELLRSAIAVGHCSTSPPRRARDTAVRTTGSASSAAVSSAARAEGLEPPGDAAYLHVRTGDGRLRFAVDVYSYKYSDLQVDFFDAAKIQFITKNAGSSRAKGIETEVEWAPAETGAHSVRW